VEALRREADAGMVDELIARAGLPNVEQQRALLDALDEALWQRLTAAGPKRRRVAIGRAPANQSIIGT
jgi:hypothetical protein